MRLNGTLSIKGPFGRTIGLSLVILLIMFGLSEILLRASFLQSYLNQIVPSLGSRHHQMELQLARLEQLYNSEGSVDCIFLGSSLTWLGFNANVFNEEFSSITGQDIRCTNLGIETLPANAAGELAEIVINRYQPRLLIYGTSARDYAVTIDSEDAHAVLDTPWLRYQLGHHSALGWLYSYSYLLRYAQMMSSLVHLDRDSLQEIGSSANDLSGFLGKTRPAQEIHYQAAAKDAQRWLQPYEIRQENVDGLEQVLDEQSVETQVIIVEMPVNQSYFDYFENGKSDYDRFVTQVASTTSSRDILFIRTSDSLQVQDEGWWDRSHMNMKGAEFFSTWLGDKIAQAVLEGNLVLSDSPGDEASADQSN
jgi:hypothetical protein